MALRAVPDHPKFADLMARLGRPKYVALGCLEAIWHFTGRFTPQGNIGKYTDQAIEAWVGWEGNPGELISALTTTHWIDPSEPFRLLVHDWHIHADNATKLALKRAKLTFCVHTVTTPSQQCNDTVQQTLIPSRLPEPVPVPVPEPEKKTKTCAPTSAAPVHVEPVTSAMWEGQPLALETVSGELWLVPAADCVAWADAYPGVNVLQELLKMREWLRANSKNRKTAGGMRRFIVSWLGRAQDRSRPSGGASNGYGNRGQARTDGNISAARVAADRLAARLADSVGGSARS